MKNYYKILGVNSSATNAEIRAAHKRLCLMFDPAVNMSKGAKGKFKEVREAYKTLAHKPSRISYDVALRIFENRNKPKERVIVCDNIPYTAGVVGVYEVSAVMESTSQYEEVPLIKVFVWLSLPGVD